MPVMSYSAVVSGYTFATRQSASRTDVSNLLFTAARNTGTFRYGVTAGAYAFPVVGQPFVSTFQTGANTGSYGFVPIAFAQYAPSDSFTLSVGKLATLLGQESGFTFQNVNIQRGLVWGAEPTISRGVRAAYTKNNLTLDVELNDGYYSGSRRAIEGLLGYAPAAATNVQFAFIIPDANTPGNCTSAVANKAEYNIMLTQTFGKLQLTPYLLFVDSPASASAGYTAAESAYAQVFIANYTFDPAYSLAMRYEHLANRSAPGDTSGNADLVGYGPGSSASGFTVTPAYRYKQLTVRGEYSSVNASRGASAQTRIGFEILGQF